MNIGDVYVNVIPNMEAFTAEVDTQVAAAGAAANESAAAGVAGGAEKGAAASVAGTSGSWKTMAKLAGGFLAYEFIKSSVTLTNSYNMAVNGLRAALEKAKLASYLPDLTSWTVQFSENTGLAQVDLLKLERQLVAAGATNLTQIEQLSNAAEGMAILSNKTVNLWTRQVIPALFNNPSSALTTLEKWHVLSMTQAAQIKQLQAAGQTALASQMALEAFIKRGTGVAEKTATPLAKFHAELQALQITMGQTLMPIILAFTKALGAVFGWLGKNKIALDVVVGALAAVGVGIIAIKLGSFADGIGKLITRMQGWRVATEEAGAAQVAFTTEVEASSAALDVMPWMLVAAAAIAAVTLIIHYWTPIKHFFEDLGIWIAKHWKVVLAVITGGLALIPIFVAEHVGAIVSFFVKLWDDIKNATRGPLDVIRTVLVDIFDVAKGIFEGIARYVGFVVRVYADAFKWIADHWKLMLAVMTGGLALVVAFIVEHWRGIGTALTRVFDVVKNIAVNTWHVIGELLTPVVTAVRVAVVLTVKWVEMLVTVFRDVFGWLTRNWQVALAFLTGGLSLAVEFIAKHWKLVAAGFRVVYDAVRDVVLAVWHSVEAVFAPIVGVIRGAVELVMHGFGGLTGFFGGIFKWISDNWKTVLAVLTGGLSLAVGFIVSHWREVTAFFIGAWNAMKTAGVAVWHAIEDALTPVEAVVGAVVRYVERLFTGLVTFFGGTFRWIESHWKVVLAVLTGGLSLAVAFIVSHWKQVEAGFEVAWNALKRIGLDVWHALVVGTSPLVAAIKFVIGIVEDLIHALEKAFGWVGKIAHDVGHFFGGAIHVVGDVGHFITHPFGLAEGGIVTQPMRPLVGEAGPEAVIPLHKLPDMMFGGSGRLELRITNWQDGTGYLRFLTRDETAQKQTYDTQLSRMGR